MSQEQQEDLNDNMRDFLGEIGYNPRLLDKLTLGQRIELVDKLRGVQRDLDRDAKTISEDPSDNNKRFQMYDYYEPIIHKHFKEYDIKPSEGEVMDNALQQPKSQAIKDIQAQLGGGMSAIEGLKRGMQEGDFDSNSVVRENELDEVPKKVLPKEPISILPKTPIKYTTPNWGSLEQANSYEKSKEPQRIIPQSPPLSPGSQFNNLRTQGYFEGGVVQPELTTEDFGNFILSKSREEMPSEGFIKERSAVSPRIPVDLSNRFNQEDLYQAAKKAGLLHLLKSSQQKMTPDDTIMSGQIIQKRNK
jgi:hypothetical protein